MAKKGTYEYECPQFVDFAAGLDNMSGREEIYFDCDDRSSNDDVFKNLLTPDVTGKTRYLSEATENKLLTKVTAALNVIDSTPRLAMFKKQQQSENVGLKKPQWKLGGKAFKRNTVQVPNTTLVRSKSIAALHKSVWKPVKEKGLRKRSSSLNDLKTAMAKKQTCPMTPMCLKRTIIKSKKVIKSTEEIELEEIARLQKQLFQHLRYNELSMKKLNLKPKQNAHSRNIPMNANNLKEVGEKGLNPILHRLNLPPKDTRRDLRQLSPDALKKEAQRVDAVISKHKSRISEKSTRENRCVTLKKAVVVHEVEEEEANKVLQKPLPQRKIGFHSGLLFHDNVKKNTVVKPFSFDFKQREVKVSTIDDMSSMAVQDLKFSDSKENIPVNRVRPFFNVKNLTGLQTQNQKLEDMKRLETVKKSVRKIAIARKKGLALSENIARN